MMGLFDLIGKIIGDEDTNNPKFSSERRAGTHTDEKTIYANSINETAEYIEDLAAEAYNKGNKELKLTRRQILMKANNAFEIRNKWDNPYYGDSGIRFSGIDRIENTVINEAIEKALNKMRRVVKKYENYEENGPYIFYF
jgi:hypothetical protein